MRKSVNTKQFRRFFSQYSCGWGSPHVRRCSGPRPKASAPCRAGGWAVFRGSLQNHLCPISPNISISYSLPACVSLAVFGSRQRLRSLDGGGSTCIQTSPQQDQGHPHPAGIPQTGRISRLPRHSPQSGRIDLYILHGQRRDLIAAQHRDHPRARALVWIGPWAREGPMRGCTVPGTDNAEADTSLNQACATSSHAAALTAAPGCEAARSTSGSAAGLGRASQRSAVVGEACALARTPSFVTAVYTFVRLDTSRARTLVCVAVRPDGPW